MNREHPHPFCDGTVPTEREDMASAAYDAMMQKGLDNVQSGNTVPFEEAMKNLRCELFHESPKYSKGNQHP